MSERRSGQGDEEAKWDKPERRDVIEVASRDERTCCRRKKDNGLPEDFSDRAEAI